MLSDMVRNFRSFQISMLSAHNAVCSDRDGDEEKTAWRKEEPKEDIDVCLNCTKAKCSGTFTCFNKHKTKK